ncbi:hypothetical protein BJV74DRAFT_794429 [Russula compacta]|nr:hypothetical protein BJV74DRAFT_794429 [Russula compacta]
MVDSATNSISEHRREEPLQGLTPTIPMRGSPPSTTGGQNAFPVVRYPPTFSSPFRGTIRDAQHRSPGFVATPFAIAQQDSVNGTLSTNVPEARQYAKSIVDGWNQDAKGVLMFTSVFSAIVASFIIESYKFLSPNLGDSSPPTPATSIVCVNTLWLLSLVLSITSALFATLMQHWTRRHIQLAQDSNRLRDPAHTYSSLFPSIQRYFMHRAVTMTVTILHLSVFLFLVGLVVFFFTINKIVAIFVLAVVGLFGVVYLTLTIHACIDRNFLYRTPLSGGNYAT